MPFFIAPVYWVGAAALSLLALGCGGEEERIEYFKRDAEDNEPHENVKSLAQDTYKALRGAGYKDAKIDSGYFGNVIPIWAGEKKIGKGDERFHEAELYGLARKHFEKNPGDGEFKDLIAMYDHIAEGVFSYARRCFDRIRCNDDDNHFQIRNYRRALALNPQHGKALFQLGLELYQIGEFADNEALHGLLEKPEYGISEDEQERYKCESGEFNRRDEPIYSKDHVERFIGIFANKTISPIDSPQRNRKTEFVTAQSELSAVFGDFFVSEQEKTDMGKSSHTIVDPCINLTRPLFSEEFIDTIAGHRGLRPAMERKYRILDLLRDPANKDNYDMLIRVSAPITRLFKELDAKFQSSEAASHQAQIRSVQIYRNQIIVALQDFSRNASSSGIKYRVPNLIREINGGTLKMRAVVNAHN